MVFKQSETVVESLRASSPDAPIGKGKVETGALRILAAIVTYNRSALLKRCIDHVLAQSQPPDDLIVINNSSTDDTQAMLERHGIAVITQANGGGAAGFHRAIRHALEKCYDAVWLMDDDGYPGAGALEILVGEMKPGIACASAVALRQDDPSRFVFPYPKLNRLGLPVIFGLPRKFWKHATMKARYPDRIYPYVHPFNGALVALEAVRRTGNVETGFFIFGDETDFILRLRSAGGTLSHLDAHHYHPDVSKRPLSDEKIYYYVKNSLILNRRYLNAPGIRSVMNIAATFGRVFARNGPRFGLSLLLGRKRRVLWTAIARGRRGQVGADYGR